MANTLRQQGEHIKTKTTQGNTLKQQGGHIKKTGELNNKANTFNTLRQQGEYIKTTWRTH